jgi:hypothetical protein
MAKPPLPVSFRLPPEIKAAAEKAAADDHRSLSSLVEKVLADYLKKQGYLPDPAVAAAKRTKRKGEST